MTEERKAPRGQGHEESAPLEKARSSAAFVEWRDALPSFDLDGERLYLPTGDVPVGEGELAEDWLRSERDEPGD